jgi:hypothetical protein
VHAVRSPPAICVDEATEERPWSSGEIAGLSVSERDVAIVLSARTVLRKKTDPRSPCGLNSHAVAVMWPNRRSSVRPDCVDGTVDLFDYPGITRIEVNAQEPRRAVGREVTVAEVYPEQVCIGLSWERPEIMARPVAARTELDLGVRRLLEPRRWVITPRSC